MSTNSTLVSSTSSTHDFKPYVAKFMQFNWRTGVLLLAIFSSVRFYLALQASVTKSYQTISIIFLLMMVMPFVVLTKQGRRKIGLTLPTRGIWIVIGGLFGIISCSAMFVLASFFFDLGIGNWFVYIASTYSNVPPVLTSDTRFTFFLIYSATSMFFSPIGEELFYRGMIHECFAESFTDKTASMVDSAAFALVHLAHFGILYTGSGWEFLPFPSGLWVSSLFVTCLLFYTARAKSGSILGAIVSHALFNTTMNYFIFYHIF